MTGNVFMKKRIAKVFIVFFAAFFFLTFRLAWIQFVKGGELQLQALDNRLREVPVEAKRGTIYDKAAKILQNTERLQAAAGCEYSTICRHHCAAFRFTEVCH